jgi:hypothetical protein
MKGEEGGGKEMKKEKREKEGIRKEKKKQEKNLTCFIHLKLQGVSSYFVPQISMRFLCMFILLKLEAPH